MEEIAQLSRATTDGKFIFCGWISKCLPHHMTNSCLLIKDPNETELPLSHLFLIFFKSFFINVIPLAKNMHCTK